MQASDDQLCRALFSQRREWKGIFQDDRKETHSERGANGAAQVWVGLEGHDAQWRFLQGLHWVEVDLVSAPGLSSETAVDNWPK